MLEGVEIARGGSVVTNGGEHCKTCSTQKQTVDTNKIKLLKPATPPKKIMHLQISNFKITL